jgi:CBS-domain-containing membrane protein
MVVDDLNKLSGVVTMFDVLYHLRPSYLNLGIDGEELDWEGQLKSLVYSFRDKKVHQVMTRSVVGVAMEDHILVALDRMVKHKYRQLPVLRNGQPIGVVYISDIFNRVF